MEGAVSIRSNDSSIHSSIQQFNIYEKTLGYLSQRVGNSCSHTMLEAYDCAAAALACCKRRLNGLEVSPLASASELLQFEASLEVAGEKLRVLESIAAK